MTDPIPGHAETLIVWDGRRVVAAFPDDDDGRIGATAKVDELRDAGNPSVRLWGERTCAWVNTTLRADGSQLAALEVGGLTVLAYARRLGQLAALHIARGGPRCDACAERWPCPTYRLATAPVDS